MSNTPPPVEPPEPGDAPPTRFMTIGLDARWLRRSLMLIIAALLAWQVIQWAWTALAGFAFNLLLAWLIAISFDPVINLLVRRGWKRGSATGLVLGVVYLASAAFLVVFGGLFVQQVAQFITTLPQIVADLVAWINDTFHTAIDAQQAISAVNVTPEQLGANINEWGGGVFGLVTSFFGVVVNFLMVMIFSFYLAADAPRIRRAIASWMPYASQRVVITVWDISVEKAGAFVLSKIILATISAFFYSLFFSIIGVPFWLPMGIFVGFVGQFIPMIGTYIGIAVPMVFAVTVNPLNALWILLFATAYQQIETYFLTPRLATRVMSMNSGIALAAVFIGAALFGPIGAIIGIPLVAIVMAIADTYGHRYRLVPELRHPGEYEDMDEVPPARPDPDDSGDLPRAS